uniref:Uncharacterized protein n=1 Tax=Romanomermis culicivorax TaxID=13658 RepID=A0A915HTL3_ROMCU
MLTAEYQEHEGFLEILEKQSFYKIVKLVASASSATLSIGSAAFEFSLTDGGSGLPDAFSCFVDDPDGSGTSPPPFVAPPTNSQCKFMSPRIDRHLSLCFGSVTPPLGVELSTGCRLLFTGAEPVGSGAFVLGVGLSGCRLLFDGARVEVLSSGCRLLFTGAGAVGIGAFLLGVVLSTGSRLLFAGAGFVVISAGCRLLLTGAVPVGPGAFVLDVALSTACTLLSSRAGSTDALSASGDSVL